MTGEAQDAPPPFNLTELDHQILAQTDEEFQPHTWDELRHIIGELLLGLGGVRSKAPTSSTQTGRSEAEAIRFAPLSEMVQ